MTNYSSWDSKAAKLVKEAEQEDEKEEKESSQALGLQDGPQGPTTVKAKAEMKELDAHSQQRKDFIEWSKSREVTLTHGPQEKSVELAGAEMDGKAIRLSGSEGVSYVVISNIVKLMVDKCKHVKIRVLDTITTSNIELYSCEDLDVEVFKPLGTLQVDECTASARVRYAERDHVGRIYHHNSPGLSIGWAGPEGEMHNIGSDGAVQLCTQLNAESAAELFNTTVVQRDHREYPVDLAGAPSKISEEQKPDLGAGPADEEERRQVAEQRRQAGNDMFRANDFMQATVRYTESLQLDPTVGAVWANRAQCWLKLGDHDKALADAEKCTEVEPANPKGWFRKGMSLHAMKRFQEAIPALIQAEKLEPTNKQVVDAIKMAQMMARKSAASA